MIFKYKIFKMLRFNYLIFGALLLTTAYAVPQSKEVNLKEPLTVANNSSNPPESQSSLENDKNKEEDDSGMRLLEELLEEIDVQRNSSEISGDAKEVASSLEDKGIEITDDDLKDNDYENLQKDLLAALEDLGSDELDKLDKQLAISHLNDSLHGIPSDDKENVTKVENNVSLVKDNFENIELVNNNDSENNPKAINPMAEVSKVFDEDTEETTKFSEYVIAQPQLSNDSIKETTERDEVIGESTFQPLIEIINLSTTIRPTEEETTLPFNKEEAEEITESTKKNLENNNDDKPEIRGVTQSSMFPITDATTAKNFIVKEKTDLNNDSILIVEEEESVNGGRPEILGNKKDDIKKEEEKINENAESSSHQLEENNRSSDEKLIENYPFETATEQSEYVKKIQDDSGESTATESEFIKQLEEKLEISEESGSEITNSYSNTELIPKILADETERIEENSFSQDNSTFSRTQRGLKTEDSNQSTTDISSEAVTLIPPSDDSSEFDGYNPDDEQSKTEDNEEVTTIASKDSKTSDSDYGETTVISNVLYLSDSKKSKIPVENLKSEGLKVPGPEESEKSIDELPKSEEKIELTVIPLDESATEAYIPESLEDSETDTDSTEFQIKTDLQNGTTEKTIIEAIQKIETKSNGDSETAEDYFKNQANRYEYAIYPENSKIPCILASMAIKFKIPDIRVSKYTNISETVEVPKNATATGICDSENSSLTLSWKGINGSSDETNSITFQFGRDRKQFFMKKVDVKYYLDKNVHPFATGGKEKLITGNATTKLFSASVNDGIHLCHETTTIPCDSLDVVVEDVALIAYNENADISKRIGIVCPEERSADLFILGVIGSVAGVIMSVFIVCLFVSYKKRTTVQSELP